MNSEEKINLAKLVSQIQMSNVMSQSKQTSTTQTENPQSQTENQIKQSNYNVHYYNRKRRHEKKTKNNVIGAGGLILDISNNKLLVVKGPEKWSLPKGHLEPGEEPYEAAMREIFEETSLQVELNETVRSKKLRKYVYYYIILENAGQLQLNAIDNNEVSEVRWCSYSELLTLSCNKQLKYFIDKWKATIKVFYDNQRSLTIKGSVPDHEEMILLKQEIAEEHSLYNELYSTPRKGISKKDEDVYDEELSDSDTDDAE